MTIPLNRVVTFAGPYISLLAGAVATWLVVKLNVLAIPGLGLNGEKLELGIAGLFTWGLTSGLSHLGQWSWLKGHHIELTYSGVNATPSWLPTSGMSNFPVDQEPDQVEHPEALDAVPDTPEGEPIVVEPKAPEDA